MQCHNTFLNSEPRTSWSRFSLTAFIVVALSKRSQLK